MKTMLMAVMAVAVAVMFSVPSFAEEGKKKEKGGHVVVYGDKKNQDGGKADDLFGDKKEEKKGGHADTFGEKKDKDKGGK
ncbi:MAG: hypothetical protein KF693_07445 [Nitrospira sp.]|nr:hypothetical protein [Nitrospira sp.]